MALSKISELGNGTGLVYEVAPGGSIRNYWPNSASVRSLLKNVAVRSSINYVQNTLETAAYTENFHDPDGFRYYLDSNSGAVGTSMSGDTIEITKYVMPAQKHPVQEVSIASGVLSVNRFGPITVVYMQPESGNADDLDYIRGANVTSRENDFQEGDIVIVKVKDTNDIITCKHATSGIGHLRMSGKMHYAVKGTTLTPFVAFIKREETSDRGWEEIFRTGTFLQTKTLTVSGGAQSYNPSTDPSLKVDNQDGVIMLNAAGVTQTGALSVSTSDALPGQKYKIIPNGNWTAYGVGGSVTLFGITIPESLAKNGNWQVEAFYDQDNATWVAKLGGTSTLAYHYRTAPSGESSYTNQSLVGLSAGDFIYMLGGIGITFQGSRASASFNSGTGTITYTAAIDADTDAHLIILKTP